jgi:hypothetical protein
VSYDPAPQYVYFGCDKNLRTMKVGISKQPDKRHAIEYEEAR